MDGNVRRLSEIGAGCRGMVQAIDDKALARPIKAYRQQLDAARAAGGTNELQLRHAFANLLRDLAGHAGWTFQEETAAAPVTTTTDGAARDIRPDGLLKKNELSRGVWEAKDPKDNLDAEIRKKIDRGYPTFNAIFENTRTAILYQDGKPAGAPFDLGDDDQLADLLRRFFAYTNPTFESFDRAVIGFRDRVVRLSEDLKTLIAKAHAGNKAFRDAFGEFAELCRDAINPNLGRDDVDELLIQHLLIQRLIEKIFDLPDFFQENAIARAIEGVIQTLTGSGFDRQAFYKELNHFYEAIEAGARLIGDDADAWDRKQGLLNDVYERFFQGYARDVADTHGIVYTPQAIVEFMNRSVEHVLKAEFGKALGDPWVCVLDPCTGTGNFVVNLLRRIPKESLADAYRRRLFANEVQLLPYYIASLNIEHAYYELTGTYEPFPGLCFVDTLELVRDTRPAFAFMTPENTERVEAEQAAPITVILGNPPYNVGQKSENDNNKNRVYRRKSKSDLEGIDDRISATYATDSRATNKNALSDMYVKFFRWASDRLGKNEGVICFVSNNSFVDGIAYDGMRKHLLNDFDTIYHFNFKGNARTSGERRRQEGGNIFGDQIRVGIGITLFIRKRSRTDGRIYYHEVGDYWKARQKKEYLESYESVVDVPWQSLIPDTKHNWLVPRGAEEFEGFVPIGTKETKAADEAPDGVIFNLYSVGVKTNRDQVVYDFDRDRLIEKVKAFIDAYNYEVYRYRKHGEGKTVDEFVSYEKIPWSEGLKKALQRGLELKFDEGKVRRSSYRPFTEELLYFDRLLIERVYQYPAIFPLLEADAENLALCATDLGSEKPFMLLMTDRIADLHIVGAGSSAQCFPFYTYTEDGSTRRENITDWALEHFRAHYGSCLLPGESRPLTAEEVAGTSDADFPLKERQITKWDIFHYVYAVLHHPAYRERFAEVLKKELPRVPLLPGFGRYAHIGRELAGLHVHYDHVPPEGSVAFRWKDGAPISWRVERMRLSKDRTELRVNDVLTLTPIPPAAFDYRLGNRSALEWVIDQYRVDPKTGSDPNRPDDPEFIVRHVLRVLAVSLRTVEIVSSLPDWPSS